VFGNGHFANLNGLRFDFTPVGVFLLTQSPDQMFGIETRQVPCQSSPNSCADTVTIFVVDGSLWRISLVAPERAGNPALIFFNDVPFVMQGNITGPPGFIFSQISPFEFQLFGPDRLKVGIRLDSIVGKQFHINGQVSRDYCLKSTGTMGTCDPTANPRKEVPLYAGPWLDCTEYGMAHIKTFSEGDYQFPGSCEYVFVRHGLGPNLTFSVQTRHTSCVRNSVSMRWLCNFHRTRLYCDQTVTLSQTVPLC